ADALRAFPPLAHLDGQELAAMAAVTREVVYPPGGVLCRQGEENRSLFLVRSGEIRVVSRRSQGGEAEVHRLHAGDFEGLAGLFSDQPPTATLTAETESDCLVIAGDDVLSLVAGHPGISRGLLRFLGERFTFARSLVADLSPDASDRRIPVAVFDSKGYDRVSFQGHMGTRIALHFFDARLQRRTVSLARGFGVVCAFVNDRLDAETIATLAQGGTRLIAMRCAGFNNVDLEAAQAHGITVARVPAYSPYAVAEHATALLLTLNRKIHRAFNRVREGNFTLEKLVGFDLHGRTAGILGVGKIGRCMVNICRGFGMQVLGWDAYPDADFANETGMRFVSKQELFSTADVISLHAPLLPDTRHIINAESIAQMKPGVFLINTSRGGLIDSNALIDGLRSGRIGGAGLDVYEEEEGYFFEDHSTAVIQNDDLLRLISYPNVLITSHQAFLTEEALSNIATTTRDNILAFMDGEPVTNAVQVGH
ncbi:MAG: D-lactate dehydrogenase family protein, partial [Planctomycetota bacterium]